MKLINIAIRPTQYEDCNFCIDLWSDDEIGKYLSDPPKEYSYDLYESWKSSIDTFEGCYYFVGEDKVHSKLFGTCSCVPSEETGVWDIGYAIAKEYQNKGYGYAMLCLLIDDCKTNGAKSITAHVAKENIPSNGLLKKLGFSIIGEGTFKKMRTDLVYEEYLYELKL